MQYIIVPPADPDAKRFRDPVQAVRLIDPVCLLFPQRIGGGYDALRKIAAAQEVQKVETRAVQSLEEGLSVGFR